MARLKYLPSGIPILEFTVAVKQAQFGKESVGYFEAVLEGNQAEDYSQTFKVGDGVRVTGALWMRQYRSRQGSLLKEIRVVVSQIQGVEK